MCDGQATLYFVGSADGQARGFGQPMLGFLFREPEKGVWTMAQRLT